MALQILRQTIDSCEQKQFNPLNSLLDEQEMTTRYQVAIILWINLLPEYLYQ
jgi:hypothetical protein